MRLIDLYYRAFRDLRKHTQNNSESQKVRRAIIHANKKEDELTSIKYTCKIDEEWITNIEEGLIYIEKAIREERQFIRTEGEVVLIEKVKKTSKATVEHLARHSELITRVPKEGKPIVPDKLYIVEKLSDYAVYENRFIYMLLCYLRDFIHMRIDKIRDKITTYESNMKVNKEVKMNNRHVNYSLAYSDVIKNDPFLVDAYHNIPLVPRIEMIYSIVISLLSTPLMKEVSKSPMIKPPIVKTNVLRMNQNFKAALNLYDYITAYNKDGYEFEEVRKTINPFSDNMSDEIAETVELTSFINYMYGNDVIVDLKTRYEVEEKKLKEEENQKAVEELKRLKKRLVEMHEDPSEYILKLEKRNRNLEKESSEWVLEKQKNEELQKQILDLENKTKEIENSILILNSQLQEKTDEIVFLNQKYFDDMTQTEEVHRQEMVDLETTLIEEHEKAKETLIGQYEVKISDIKDLHNSEIIELNRNHELAKQNLIAGYEEIIHSLKQQINAKEQDINSLKQKTKELISENEETVFNYENRIKDFELQIQEHDNERRTAIARFYALREQQGLITEDEDFTTKEKFKELELEMNAYKRFFKEQWKKTKMKIREMVKEEARLKRIKQASDKKVNESSSEMNLEDNEEKII